MPPRPDAASQPPGEEELRVPLFDFPGTNDILRHEEGTAQPIATATLSPLERFFTLVHEVHEARATSGDKSSALWNPWQVESTPAAAVATTLEDAESPSAAPAIAPIDVANAAATSSAAAAATAAVAQEHKRLLEESEKQMQALMGSLQLARMQAGNISQVVGQVLSGRDMVLLNADSTRPGAGLPHRVQRQPPADAQRHEDERLDAIRVATMTKSRDLVADACTLLRGARQLELYAKHSKSVTHQLLALAPRYAVQLPVTLPPESSLPPGAGSSAAASVSSSAALVANLATSSLFTLPPSLALSETTSSQSASSSVTATNTASSPLPRLPSLEQVTPQDPRPTGLALRWGPRPAQPDAGFLESGESEDAVPLGQMPLLCDEFGRLFPASHLHKYRESHTFGRDAVAAAEWDAALPIAAEARDVSAVATAEAAVPTSLPQHGQAGLDAMADSAMMESVTVATPQRDAGHDHISTMRRRLRLDLLGMGARLVAEKPSSARQVPLFVEPPDGDADPLDTQSFPGSMLPICRQFVSSEGSGNGGSAGVSTSAITSTKARGSHATRETQRFPLGRGWEVWRRPRTQHCPLPLPSLSPLLDRSTVLRAALRALQWELTSIAATDRISLAERAMKPHLLVPLLVNMNLLRQRADASLLTLHSAIEWVRARRHIACALLALHARSKVEVDVLFQAEAQDVYVPTAV